MMPGMLTVAVDGRGDARGGSQRGHFDGRRVRRPVADGAVPIAELVVDDVTTGDVIAGDVTVRVHRHLQALQRRAAAAAALQRVAARPARRRRRRPRRRDVAAPHQQRAAALHRKSTTLDPKHVPFQ